MRSLLGLSDRELTQYGPEVIASWLGLHRVSDKLFTGVIDAGPGIGAFARCPYPVLFDGLFKDDIFWYTQCVAADGSQPVEMKFDRPQPLAGMTIWLSDDYFMIQDVELSFDDKDARRYTLKETKEPQELTFALRVASKVTLRVKSTYPGSAKKDLVTISEIELTLAASGGLEQEGSGFDQAGRDREISDRPRRDRSQPARLQRDWSPSAQDRRRSQADRGGQGRG